MWKILLERKFQEENFPMERILNGVGGNSLGDNHPHAKISVIRGFVFDSKIIACKVDIDIENVSC